MWEHAEMKRSTARAAPRTASRSVLARPCRPRAEYESPSASRPFQLRFASGSVAPCWRGPEVTAVLFGSLPGVPTLIGQPTDPLCEDLCHHPRGKLVGEPFTEAVPFED